MASCPVDGVFGKVGVAVGGEVDGKLPFWAITCRWQ